MKVRIEIDESLKEQEVIIRAPAWSEEINSLKEEISTNKGISDYLSVWQKDTEIFLMLSDILFLETENKIIYAHTCDKMLQTDYRLYELEERLPGYFMRISKSTIVNCNHIFSITRNLTASSIVAFRDSHKQVYVSRQYYKVLKEYMAEKRRR